MTGGTIRWTLAVAVLLGVLQMHAVSTPGDTHWTTGPAGAMASDAAGPAPHSETPMGGAPTGHALIAGLCTFMVMAVAAGLLSRLGRPLPSRHRDRHAPCSRGLRRPEPPVPRSLI